jgi:glycerate kinase
VKIVIAPDSFKESLSAREVADCLETGFRRAMPDLHCVKVPVADGGEGTVDALVSATNGRRRRKMVRGPLGRKLSATFGVLGDGKTAVIEMAAASGLHLVPTDVRDPTKPTTFGTGELIRASIDGGANRLIIGIRGSATNGGGAGMAQALGIRFFDETHRLMKPGIAGGDLGRVRRIDTAERLIELDATEVLVACDVRKKPVGASGAAAVYAPQKGATPQQVDELGQNLLHFCDVIERDLIIPVKPLKGGGAAGGLGAGLCAFAGGKLISGFGLVIEAAGLLQHLANADLVITGEGRIDAQTLAGKAPSGVAIAASCLGVPVVAVGGALGRDARQLFKHGVDALESTLVRESTLQQALTDSRGNLRDTGERIGKWLLLGQKISTASAAGSVVGDD